jgi:hypothetical protein
VPENKTASFQIPCSSFLQIIVAFNAVFYELLKIVEGTKIKTNATWQRCGQKWDVGEVQK